MKTITQRTTDKLRLNLLPLAKSCPVDTANPEDCPLAALRKLPSPQRSQWFKALDQPDLVYLATYCHICTTTKLAGQTRL